MEQSAFAQEKLRILLVTDQYYAANNGMTISARRFAAVLRGHGHEVRVLSCGTPEQVEAGQTAYLLEKKRIPIFDDLISSQGMTFARRDKAVIRRAVQWADVVHFLMPFALSRCGARIAQECGVPFTAAFHVQPENITSSIHLGKIGWINTAIYHGFHAYFYKFCTHIHCPSEFIAGELRRTGYRERLHVISNGIDPDFHYRKIEKTPEFAGKFVILMTGRLSVEKRQDVLIDAVARSRYKQQIHLVLAGNGPRRKQLLRRAHRRGVQLTNRFFPKAELLDMIAMADLYVHAADMEIEAMSCMEAFAGGLVPIIADSRKSATPQFALDERSLFRAGDSADLARKIDAWIDHPQERQEMERAYSRAAENYNLEACVCRMEEMFRLAIAENGSVRHER